MVMVQEWNFSWPLLSPGAILATIVCVVKLHEYLKRVFSLLSLKHIGPHENRKKGISVNLCRYLRLYQEQKQ